MVKKNIGELAERLLGGRYNNWATSNYKHLFYILVETGRPQGYAPTHVLPFTQTLFIQKDNKR